MKVIATDITNLTDARYFAAWGVDLLCYCIDEGTADQISPDTLKEITDWVEGPATGLKSTGISLTPLHADTTKEVGILHMIIGPYIDEAEIPEGITDVYRICTLKEGWQDNDKLILTLEKAISKLSPTELERIGTLAKERVVYIDGLFKASDLPVLENIGIEGIVLKGGEEEKVGYKSFDELDEILEELYD